MAKSHAGTPWSSSQLTHGNNVQSIYSPLLSATSPHVLGQQNLAAAHGSAPYEVSVASGDTLARCALCPEVAAENVVTSLSHLSHLSISRPSFSRPSLSRPSISRPLLPSSTASLTPSSFSQAGTGSITDHGMLTMSIALVRVTAVTCIPQSHLHHRSQPLTHTLRLPSMVAVILALTAVQRKHLLPLHPRPT